LWVCCAVALMVSACSLLSRCAVLLALGHRSGEFDRHLFVGDRGLERRQVGQEQPVDHGRLVLLGAPDQRQRLAQGHVAACAVVRERQRLELDAVHDDDAHAGESVVVELAERFAHQVAPGEALVLDRRAFRIEQAECHDVLRDRDKPARQTACLYDRRGGPKFPRSWRDLPGKRREAAASYSNCDNRPHG